MMMTTMLKKEVMRRKKVSPLVICECHIHSKYMKISCLMQQRLPWRSPSSSSSWIFSLYQTKSGFLSETLNLEAAPRMQAQSSTPSGGLYIQPHIFFLSSLLIRGCNFLISLRSVPVSDVK